MSAHAVKIPFGERDGRFYDPISVDRGKACGCICPACRQPLIAKRGKPRSESK